MSVKTTLSRPQQWRLFFIAALCAVFGLWGIYDYVWAIPAKQRLADRYEVLLNTKAAFETSQQPGEVTPETKKALESINAELNRMFSRELKSVQEQRGVLPLDGSAGTEARGGGPDGSVSDPAAPGLVAERLKEQSGQALSQLLSSDDRSWFELLLVSNHALVQPRETGNLQGESLKAYETVKSALTQIGTPSKPSKFDRAMQWAFILCLPCVPWFLWQYHKDKSQATTLHDDGSLELPPPHGTWARDDIADIDMSRWMRKSIATVVHRDGRRVALDDYKQKNTHLIVGSIASEKYPDQWTSEAKPVKSAAGSTVDSTGLDGSGEPVQESAGTSLD